MATDSNTRLLPKIVIQPHEWEELSTILARYAPDRTIWAFGSRATGRRVRRFSDLDIVVGGKELSFDDLAALRNALDESRLPFKVDIVELESLTPDFRSRIQDDLVLLQ